MAGEDNRGPQGPPERPEARSDRAFLAGVCLLALVLRAAAGWASGAAAPQEIRYVTIAQGILAGHGFAGIDTRFPDLIQPPVFPALLAVWLAVFRDPLFAARSLSIAAGVLLVLPVAALTRRILGRAAARRAAFLVAVYPLLIHISGICMTEPTFALFIALAALCLLSAVEGKREVRNALLAGALLGMGFLTRPEGLAYLGAAGAMLFLDAWLSHRRPVGRALALAALPAAAFLALAAPYWIWLHGETGRWLIAPKALLSQVHNSIMAEGVEEKWPERYGSRVFYERVKFGLNEEGTGLRSDEAFRTYGLLPGPGGANPTKALPGKLLDVGHLTGIVLKNLRQLYLDTLKYGLVLPTLLLGFLVLGVTSRPWLSGAPRRGHSLLVWFILAGGSWAFSYVQPRFLYPAVIFLMPWMAEGWARTEEWLATSVGPSPSVVGRFLSRSWKWILPLVVAAACLVHVIPPVQIFSSMWAEHRVAGMRLRESGAEPGTVMALTPVTAFYAGMRFDVLPYADLDRVLAYARMRGVRYLVADMAEFPTDRPQLMALLDPDQAPRGLEVSVDINADPERRLVVYDLGPPSSVSSTGGPVPG